MARVPVRGDHLGAYRVEQLLARGGMGLVYMGYDAGLHRWVAIKVLRPELAVDASVARSFLQEAHAAALLNHPNIVHIYTAGEQDGIVYFAMELVEGQTFEVLLQREKQLEPRRAIELIRQSALGLQHAFQHNIIHGDIKPGNLLVTGDGTVKLTDFGLARHLHMTPQSAAGGEFYGTPEYLSPEVAQGQLGDQRSDIYSLGITLYYMLTGQRPFTGASPQLVLKQQIHLPHTPVTKRCPQVSPALNQLVNKMLAKHPADRPQDYGELIAALDAARRAPRAVAELQTGSRNAPAAATPRPSPTPRTPRAQPTPRTQQPSRTSPPPPTPITLPPAVAPTATPPHKPPHSVWEFAVTVAAVVAVLGVGGYFFVKKLRQIAASRTMTATPAGAPNAINPEARAAAALMPLTSAANKYITVGRLGEAWKVYDQFDAKQYGQTHAAVSVKAARERILESANNAIAQTRDQARAAAKKNKFTDALNLWDQCANACQGIGPLAPVFTEELLRAVAARQDRVVQLYTQLRHLDKLAGTLVVSLQWDKLRDNVRTATAELPPGLAARQTVAVLQDEAPSLDRLRSNVWGRIKHGASPTVKLATRDGALQGQLVDISSQTITLRQPLGEKGFGERTIAWNELAPATVASLYNQCLDVTNPDEVFGFGILTVRQALARQAKVADAQATLQTLPVLAPGHADLIAHYQQLLAGGESSDTAAHLADAESAWQQTYAAITNGDWAAAAKQLKALRRPANRALFGPTDHNDLSRLNQLLTRMVAGHDAPSGTDD